MKWFTHIGDFANMLKAFIGSNYLGVAFAFYQSGLGLGIIGMLFVSGLTAHCCHLIVKTKYHAIKYKMQETEYKPTKRYLATSDSEDMSDIELDFDDVHEKEEHFKRHMSYGDIGWNAFGKSGLYIVNFFIALTQFGFCIGYFIFIGNTLSGLFPFKYCENSILTNESFHTYPFCDGAKQEQLPVNKSFDLLTQRLVRGLHFSEDFDTKNTSNFTTVTPSFTTENTTVTTPDSIINISSTAAYLTTTTQNSSTTLSPLNISEISSIVQQSTAPSLKILVAAPLPIFIIFALIRSIRKMSSISLIANLSIFAGCLAVFIFLIIDFSAHTDIQYFNWSGFPIFFGQVTAAFEGIGLVIPVESSMEGNRHNFALFLYGAIAVLTFILGGFGILGYIRFGSDTAQMLNLNIPPNTWESFSINICVMIGVGLTFPLMIYPVIEMFEGILFSHGSILGPKKKEDDQEESLLPKDSPDLVKIIPKEVSTWKRNIVRFLIVCVCAGIAVIFRNSFAYIGAFTGAIGSSLLAYILPCLFHLKICWKDLSYFLIVKDITIIIIGILCSIVSLYAVIVKLIHQTNV